MLDEPLVIKVARLILPSTPIFDRLNDIEVWNRALRDIECCKIRRTNEEGTLEDHVVALTDDRHWAPIYYWFKGATADWIGRCTDRPGWQKVQGRTITDKLNERCCPEFGIPTHPRQGELKLNGMEIESHRALVHACLSVVLCKISKELNIV